MNKINILLTLSIFTICSCSGLNGYYSKLEKDMMSNRAAQAQSLTASSEKTYGNKNKLLYYLDLGFLQHISNKYEQSNATFEQAKQIYSENYTKSISAGTVSLFSNDTVIPYYGKPYEMAYVNVFCALNYILQGQDNEAVVEARQFDNLLKKQVTDTNGKAFYTDDPFVRYFMGIVYENAGYYNDALVSYKLALKNYEHSNEYNLQPPQDLISSLYYLYLKLGFSQEASDLKQQYSVTTQAKKGNYGELIIINYNGLSPKKIDNIIEMSFYKAWPYFTSAKIESHEQEQAQKVISAVQAGFSDSYLKIAFPQYERYDNKVSSFVVEELNFENKETGSQYKSFEASDIGTLLINALQDETSAIHAKTIARAVGRFVLAKVVTDQVRQHENKDTYGLSIIANSVLNITNSLLEKADKRSWRTLPEEINMSKIYLPEGIHTLNIKYLDSSGKVVYQDQITVNVAQNKKTFVITKSFKS